MNKCEYCDSEVNLVTVIYYENGVEIERKILCESCDIEESNLLEEEELENKCLHKTNCVV